MVEHFDKEKKHLGQSVILDTYVPLNFIKVSMNKMDFAPSLLNYIFVHSTFQKLVEIKHSRADFEPLRFVMHPSYDEKYERHDEVLTISDKVMSDYIRITAEENEKIVFLKDLKFACKPSREVQIVEGPFAGVIGRIKRIRGSRCVVLPIGEEQAVAVMDVPNKFLRYLTDEEILKLKE
jgi:transcription antitermination factor NusG